MAKKNRKKALKQAKPLIRELFEKAGKATDKESADMYIRKARRKAMKVQYKLPPSLKRRFCKHCYSFLVPGKNLRVRTQNGHVVYYCMECKKYMRFPYRKEQKKGRKL